MDATDAAADLKPSSLEGLTRELNGYAAGALSAESMPAPVKEAFFSFQSTLKDLQDISVYVGDHSLSLSFEGFEFDKIFLPKDRLPQWKLSRPNKISSAAYLMVMWLPLFSEALHLITSFPSPLARSEGISYFDVFSSTRATLSNIKTLTQKK